MAGWNKMKWSTSGHWMQDYREEVSLAASCRPLLTWKRVSSDIPYCSRGSWAETRGGGRKNTKALCYWSRIKRHIKLVSLQKTHKDTNTNKYFLSLVCFSRQSVGSQSPWKPGVSEWNLISCSYNIQNDLNNCVFTELPLSNRPLLIYPSIFFWYWWYCACHWVLRGINTLKFFFDRSTICVAFSVITCSCEGCYLASEPVDFSSIEYQVLPHELVTARDETAS